MGAAEVEVPQRRRWLAETSNLFLREPYPGPVRSTPTLALLFLTAPVWSRQSDGDERGCWKRLAERCGEELRWAKDWDEAAARASVERKPVLAVAWLYPGFDISDGSSTVFAMDPDIIELVNERCVPLRLTSDTAAPFVAQTSYGLSETAFGSGLLLVTPDGVVLADCAFLQPAVAYDFLCATLAAHPELAGHERAKKLTSEARAGRHLARGELEVAERRLGDPRSARGFLSRARLLRRRHDAAGALAALEEARQHDPGELAAEIDFEELAVLASLGGAAEMQGLCERIGSSFPDRDEACGAAYVLGLLDLAADDRAAATQRWRALVAEHPDSRWAAQAAATLLVPGAELADFQLSAPAAEVLASVRAVPWSPLPARQAQAAVEGALDWLVAERRADGTWPDASELEAEPANAISAAIDTLAVRALLAQRRPPPDLERETRLVLAAARLNLAARSDEPTYMTYEVWSDALWLELLADLLATSRPKGPADELRALGGELVQQLAQRQRTNGGWSYFEAVSLEADAEKPEQSISFVTASVVLALLRAHEAGIEVDEEMLARGIDALEAMRSEQGVFGYMLWSFQHAPDYEPVAGAAGRGPLCELALLRAGRSDPERLAAALELFFQHAATLDKERGKALMHCGPEGQGCHYVLYDYATAARALAALPAGAHKPFTARLLELLLAARRTDGAFLDTQVLGPASGTALALLAFAALDERD